MTKVGPLQIVGFAVASVMLSMVGEHTPWLTQFAIIVWGLSFGGFSTLAQTAMSRLGGSAVDITQAMATTAWNIAVAIGGAVGGTLLESVRSHVFPWGVLVLLIGSLVFINFGTNRALARAVPQGQEPAA